MEKEKFSLQFLIKSVPESLLWNYVSTTEGLSQWFATDVHRNQDGTITFDWNGLETRTAEIVEEIPDTSITFHWKDSATEEFWRMEVSVLDLTDDTVLTITDFCDPGDKEDEEELWISQVEDLKHLMGC